MREELTYNSFFLAENIGRTPSDINRSKIFLDPPPRVMKIKTKINKWDLIKLKKLLHSKGNHKQNEKTTYRMGEIIYKRSAQQGINLQNIQTAHAALYQRNKQPNQKMGRRRNQDGRVEGHALTPSCKNTRITTSCWTIIDRKTLELTKKDTPYPKTKEKPQ